MTEEQVELPLLAKPRVERVLLVETVAGLRAACKELSNLDGPFALDAERASGFKYSQRAYLIQVHRKKSAIFLIDPIAVAMDQEQNHPTDERSAIQELGSLLATDEWILHAASQDIPCLRDLGIVPTKIFDTELGSRIAGLPRVGLGAVTEHFVNVKLAKEHSAVDWSVRPLKEDWLNYAALDVDVLHELRDGVAALLTEQGKLAWAEEEFSNVAKMQPKQTKVDRWRGMSGMHEVREPRALAIARELWTAREALAEKLDVSPGRLIPDSSIVGVSTNPPRTKPELASSKIFSGRASRSYLDTWWAALHEGLNTRNLPPAKLPHVGIPNHRTWPNRFPDSDRRLKMVRIELAALSESLQIPIENLMSPETVRQVCFEALDPLTLESIKEKILVFEPRPWQVEIVCPAIFIGLTNAGMPADESVKEAKEDA
ncbi:MAG: HRDC domain-containing protein [Rhodoluna sp.]|nr:HRDC domain-containing protein [Rhodoluna sp.]